MNELAHTQQPKQYKILLIGDVCTDVYQYGSIDRISPEAPVPVFVPTYKEEREGMAGNVYANLVALGCDVTLICGHRSVKTRLVDARSKQQILRVDEDVKSTPIVFDTAIPNVYDAIIISDYAKGAVSYEMVRELIAEVKCPVFVDTKKTNLWAFQGAWVKVNELEHSRLEDDCSGLIVTRGANTVIVPHHDLEFPVPKVEVVDVTGAGDTFISAVCYEYLNTSSIESAIKFAVRASSISIQHLGCYAPTLEEINQT